jgi:glycosyltransferase involved in cell wall biosynthesis
MNRPLISVIVPIYNVEQWLPRCIDSILAQTYQNIELILLNDGSSDGSGKICDEYVLKDKRVRVIHKENEGVSVARNVAVDQAKGEYIAFVDSDDYITNDYIETLYDLCIKYNVKMSVADWCVYPINTTPKLLNREYQEYKMTKNVALEDMFNHLHFDNSPCVKLYHKSLFEDIRYPEGFVYEDLMTTFRLMLKCEEGVAYCNKQIYFYMFRPGSIEGSTFSENKMDSAMAAFKMMDAFENELAPIADAVKTKMAAFSFHLLLKMPDSYKGKKFFCDYVRSVRWNVIKNSKVRNKTRLACLASYLGFDTVKLLFKIVDRRKYL